MSSYAKKAELKKSTGVDTFKLAGKSDLASLKAEVDKIDVEKLKTVPVDLSKLSNEVVNKIVYDKFVIKVNNIDTSELVLKTKYDTDKSDIEKKLVMQAKRFLILVSLFKKTDYNVKIN